MKSRIGHYLIFVVFVVLYIIFALLLRNNMTARDLETKIGYIPSPGVMRFICADQKNLISSFLISRVISYYGSISAKSSQENQLKPDLKTLRQNLRTAVKLDPYNMDAYYFIQAVYGWDQSYVQTANAFLEYGVKYRDWDFYLPFFLGFNYSIRGNDYKKAAKYYKKAYYLSGMELMGSLAGKYMYEANDLDKAIVYLSVMTKDSKKKSIKQSYQKRLTGFKNAKKIQAAAVEYSQHYKANPLTLDILVKEGFLDKIPVDPYGGTFFLEPGNIVKTTSGFAKGYLNRVSPPTEDIHEPSH